MYLWLLIAVSWWAVLGAPPPDDSECALLLAGPPRSSAYDYTINLLKGNFGYEGQQQCITYEAVNQAYLEARQRILVSQPKGEWKPEHYASVGELVLDISTNLARRYGLTYEEIEKGLPLIDTSRTRIREVCPPVFSQVECRAGKYRRLDGLCNNLHHPTWGATNAPFQRLLSPLFADGMNAPRVARSGRALPLSRVVSRTMHPDEGFHDHAGTVMVIAWGQFMDHDYTLTGTPLDPRSRNDPEECCKRPAHLKHPYCDEIRIPEDDYFYRLFGVTCIDFVRGFPSPRPGCRLGSRVPFNTLTGVIDGNTVYGVTEKFARKLRTGYGGLLRMNPVFQEYGLKDLLPLKLDIPDEGCTRPNKNMYCFEAGEIRVNEQLVLTVMHTLMAREHNRCARALAQVNAHWDDETLYQEARRITIAQIQHITYNEFLPILLGKDVMEKFGLVLEKEGYWAGYDPHVNPDVLASFAAAAYRFGHSLLPTAVERWSKAHKFIASKRLSDLIRRPYDLYRAGVLDEYVMGLMNQVAQAMDDSITQEVTNHLFKKVGARFGMDLVSFNMQRGREFGLPGYMEFRKFCGLPGAETFEQLFGSMPNATVRKYSSIFERPDDVDLWSGGVSERALPGSMLGPTFACIIATQFSYSRRGDRFWFELPDQPSSFSPAQLAELRKSRLARVICDNTDIIDTVQLYPMVLPDHELNPRVPCRSGILPSIDFSKWAEPAPAFHAGHAEGFVTEAITVATSGSNTNVSDVIAGDARLGGQKRQVPDRDALLKYVYKNGDPEASANKKSGPAANALRRRRSPESRPLAAPLIVDYETSHGPGPDRSRPGTGWLTARSTPQLVKTSNLADFNIETLHGGVLTSDDDPPIASIAPPVSTRTPTHDHLSDKTNRTLSASDEDSTENDDREKYNKNDDPSHDVDDDGRESFEDVKQERDEREGHSNERDVSEGHSDERKSDVREGNVHEGHSNERDVREKHSDEREGHIDERDERDKYSEEREGHSDERNEREGHNDERERHSDERDERQRHSEEREMDSEEREGRGETHADHRHRPEHDHSQENVTEDSAEVHYPRISSPRRHPHDARSHYKEKPNKIQDVDLGDFSYEKIQINKEGVVVPATDSHDDTSTEYMSTVRPVAVVVSDETNESSSDEVNDDGGGSRRLTHIDDGEVKPVVEVTADRSQEDRSDESLEEEDGSGSQRSAPPAPSAHSRGDVKLQFERIPRNYSHAAAADTDDTSTSPSPPYDRHLDLKFDDVSIKLPDIKLPEDILAYSYQKPSTAEESASDGDRDREKERFYHYSEEQRDDVDEVVRPTARSDPRDAGAGAGDEGRERDTYGGGGYYGRVRAHEPREEDDDEEEDLYEKFVKERFGRGGRRAGGRPRGGGGSGGDPELRARLRRLLRRTPDPTHNNYMWALEYTDRP